MVDLVLDRVGPSCTLELADRFQLMLYDAAYLDLAIRLDLPIPTRDDQLAEAARLASVVVVPTK